MIISAVAPKKYVDNIFEITNEMDQCFGGFIRGKLLDSLIIGILCFICVSIMEMPYPVLISTIVGVTNIIPFFGPFIGAVPSGILILTVSPIQVLYFLILLNRFLVIAFFDQASTFFKDNGKGLAKSYFQAVIDFVWNFFL